MQRRTFVLNTGLLTAGLAFSKFNSFAVSLADPVLAKRLDPLWVKSLYESGNVTTYLKSKDELQYIGMPVGGIMCGMVYLGGDGRLWLWDVFNKNQSGVIYKNIPWHEKIQFTFDYARPFDGANYVEPVKDVRPLDQGFSIKVGSVEKKLSDFKEIAFEATYPVATVTYSDSDIPVSIVLKAYSPFIPLNENDSALPVTILSYSLGNKTSTAVEVELTGWLENKAAIYSANDAEYYRVNEAIQNEKFKGVFMYAKSHNWADESFWNAPDYGNFCLAGFNESDNVDTGNPIGKITSRITLSSKETKELNYAISWYFPNLVFEKIKSEGGRHYKKRF